MIKFAIGIIVGVIFIWLSVKGVEYNEILDGMQNVQHIFLIPSAFLFVCISMLRSVRWGIILSPMEKLSQKKLFPVTCVGYMAITLIPMRIGEFMRPYLVSTKSKIPMSSGVATIFLERIFDSFTILFILLLAVMSSNLPGWVVKSGYGFFITFLILFLVLLFAYRKKTSNPNFIQSLIDKFPEKINKKIEGLIHNFLEGLNIIASPKRLVYILFLSVLIWVFSALGIYSLYFSQNLHLPLISAFVILVITTIGVSLPAAPGFLGNFQFACIMALSIYGLPKSEALIFSMVFYFLGIGINILLGLIFLPSMNISYNDMKQRISLFNTS